MFSALLISYQIQLSKKRKNKKITLTAAFVRLQQFLKDINISINGQENRFWNFVKKSGFFPKMRVMGTLVGRALFRVWPPGQCAFYESRFGLAPPHTFSANRKKLNFGKIKNDKSVFSGISWPLTSFIFFFCAAFWNRLIALIKLFSLGRTVLAAAAKFGLAVGW